MHFWDDDFRRFHEEMDKVLRSFFPVEKAAGTRTPMADVYETENSVVAVFEMPGVEKEDIALFVSEDRIEVSTKKKKEEEEKKKGYYRYEAEAKSYYRIVSLPAKVVAEEAEATYKNGVLRVEIPKAEKKKLEKAKKIAIK